VIIRHWLYIVRCEVEGKSPRTVQAYHYTLGCFVDPLAEDAGSSRATEITREHVYAYLSRFKDHAADTRHRYFREVRCFFNWLVDTGYLDQTPFRGREEHPPPAAHRAAVFGRRCRCAAGGVRGRSTRDA